MLTWLQLMELPFNKTSNCWRRSCRPSVRTLDEKLGIVPLKDFRTLTVSLRAETGLTALRQKGTLLMEQMCSQPSWSLEETESPTGEQPENVQQVQAVLEEMQLRKQR